jgi:hypothetical protein
MWVIQASLNFVSSGILEPIPFGFWDNHVGQKFMNYIKILSCFTQLFSLKFVHSLARV